MSVRVLLFRPFLSRFFAHPRSLALAACLATTAVGLAADGAWLTKVPAADRARANPYARQPEAAAAGANLYRSNCARCHGDNAEGHGSRPPLRSPRIAGATDGQLAWLLKNGNAYHGMPGWGALPEQQRWQLVAFVRSLNSPAPVPFAIPAPPPSISPVNGGLQQ